MKCPVFLKNDIASPRNGIASRSNDTASHRNDTASLSYGSGSRGNDAASASNDTVSRSIDAASPADDALSRSPASISLGRDSGSLPGAAGRGSHGALSPHGARRSPGTTTGVDCEFLWGHRSGEIQGRTNTALTG